MKMCIQPCSDSISPTQDASHTPFTHTLLLRNSARHSTCTCFCSYLPFVRTLLMTCDTIWQPVNAGTTHTRRRSFHTSRQSSVHNSTDSVTPRAVPTVQETDLPGKWRYSRCLTYVYFASQIARICGASGSTLSLGSPDYSEPGPSHVFPYRITLPQNNSAQNCLTQCSTFGYPAAGMENGNECCVWSIAVERLRRSSRKSYSHRVR